MPRKNSKKDNYGTPDFDIDYWKKKMESHAIKMRGTYIQDFIMLESSIDFIIAYYFCIDGHKRNHFHHRVLSKLTFDNKQAIIGFIITNSFPDFLITKPDIMEHLKEVQDFRNILAHWFVILFEEFIEYFMEDDKALYFVQDSVKRHKPVTNEEIITATVFRHKRNVLNLTGESLWDLRVLVEERYPLK